ncbi:hypothetical protein NDU88_000628, partial [Pleurodeles waltl]
DSSATSASPSTVRWINHRTAPGTLKLQQSIQEGYCNSVTPAPASNCNSFQLVHA